MTDPQPADEPGRSNPERVERPEVIAPGSTWNVRRPQPGFGGGRGGWSGPGPNVASNRSLYVLAAVGAVVLALAIGNGTIQTSTVVTFAVLIPAIILHEISHGAVALMFGDPTAKDAGRLTLNPIKHVDPFGTVILPALLVITTGAGFGYAKPVPVNPRRLRSPRNHGLLVSLAGPATNIVLALVAAVAIRLTFSTTVEFQSRYGGFGDPPLWAHALLFFGVINVILAVFNLIPIPPLDGSALIERLLPQQWWPGYLRFRQYSMGLLLILILVVPGDPLGRLFEPMIRAWEHLVFAGHPDPASLLPA